MAHRMNGSSSSYDVFFEAVRYGRIGEEYVATVYSGSSIDSIDTFQSIVPRMAPQRYTGNLETIVRQIVKDSCDNSDPACKQKVMWWVDIATSDRNVSLIRRIKTTFGLPEETEPFFLANNLTSHDRSRFMTGIGSFDGEAVHSASLGIQTMWLSNRPIVDLGPVLSDSFCGAYGKLMEYVNSRLSIMYRLSARPDKEREQTLSYAEGVASVRTF
jgi:hypothetical protein